MTTMDSQLRESIRQGQRGRCLDQCYRLRARDAAQARRNEKKAHMQADKRAADEERLAERRQKESATMDMYVLSAIITNAHRYHQGSKLWRNSGSVNEDEIIPNDQTMIDELQVHDMKLDVIIVR